MFILIFSLLFSVHAKREMWARVSDRDGFNLEANCLFSGHQPLVLNDSLVIKVNCYGQEDLYSELIQLNKKGASLSLVRSKFGNLLSQPVSDGGSVYVYEFSEVETLALYRIEQGHIQQLPLPPKAISLQGLSVTQNKLLARFRDAHGSSQQSLLLNGQWQSAGPRETSFFFQAQSNDKIVLQKIRKGSDLSDSQPDEIVVSLNGGETFETILQDRDGDANSEYLSFWNFSVVQGEQWAVMAKTSEGDVAIVGKNSKVVKEIPLHFYFEQLDFWPLALDELGRVYVRAKRLGVHGLWRVGDRPELILRSGDTFLGDKGVLKIPHDTPFYNAPMIDKNRLFIGVGAQDFDSSTFMGQALIEILLP